MAGGGIISPNGRVPMCVPRTSVTTAIPSQPVLTDQFVRPCRLPDFLARKEFANYRLDVEDGRSVDCVEFGDKKLLAFPGE